MNTNNQQLHETLNNLNVQLGETSELDAASAQELRQALDNIRETLARIEARQAATNDEEVPISERLTDLAQQFEQSHPALAGTVRGLVDMLAQMGI